MNLSSILYCHASSQPDKDAIIFRQQSLSYRELWHRIEACASYLYQHGIKAGDRVGLALQDHDTHLLLHYALARIAAVILPIDHRWTPGEKAAAAKAFNAKIVLTESADGKIDDVECHVPDDNWFGCDRELLPTIPTENNLPLLISLSSGTTGKPTGAVVTHQQMYERFVSQWVTIGFNSSDRFISLTPLYFGAGRSFGMCFLAAGATVILDPPPHEPEDIVRAVNSHNATVTFMVPTLLRRLLPLSKKGEHLFPELNCLLLSGAALYPAEARDVQTQISANLTGYYASSEGGGISVLSASEFLQFPDTVGRATFRTEIEIVDNENSQVNTGETGRLRYRGPAVATQFLDCDGKEDKSQGDGWFYPGDLAARSESGHIILRGRDKDLINRGGVNIYPAEIEACIAQHESVNEVAVVGRQSESMGEEVIAFLVTKENADPENIRAFCRQQLASYKVPSDFVVLKELPKTNAGKIDKKHLVETKL